MDFLESLPPDCPPPQAKELTSEKTMYRISTGRPPTTDDFRSQQQEKPHARFRLPECIVCGVSVFADEADATDKLKLPKFKGMYVARVRLTPNSGHIQKTGGLSHHTFWPFAAFQPIEDVEGHTP